MWRNAAAGNRVILMIACAVVGVVVVLCGDTDGFKRTTFGLVAFGGLLAIAGVALVGVLKLATAVRRRRGRLRRTF